MHIIDQVTVTINLLKPTAYVMHQQVWHSRILQYASLYLRVLYFSQNKQ